MFLIPLSSMTFLRHIVKVEHCRCQRARQLVQVRITGDDVARIRTLLPSFLSEFGHLLWNLFCWLYLKTVGFAKDSREMQAFELIIYDACFHANLCDILAQRVFKNI